MEEIKVKHIETKDIMTKSSLPLGGYSVNPYVGCLHACKYCYASFMKRFTKHDEPWGTFVDVKNWPVIKNPSKYKNQKVIIGSVTDGYQPIEKEVCNTQRLLNELLYSQADITICTKSDLVLRDIDLLKKMSKVTVSFSINTLDEKFKEDMDQGVSIERRLKAMKQLYDEGIRTICFISPIFPGITNIEEIINRVKDQCDLIWLENLNLRGGFKKDIMAYIQNNHPSIYPLYDKIYNKKDKTYFKDLEQKVKQLCDDYQFPYLDNETPYIRSEKGHPYVVNYFYHEEVKNTNNSGVRNVKKS